MAGPSSRCPGAEPVEPSRAGRPRQLSRGRCVRPLARAPAAHRGRVGGGRGRPCGHPSCGARRRCTPPPAGSPGGDPHQLTGEVWQWTSERLPGLSRVSLRRSGRSVSTTASSWSASTSFVAVAAPPPRVTPGCRTGTSSRRRPDGPSAESGWREMDETRTISIEVCLDPADWSAHLADETRLGLSERPPSHPAGLVLRRARLAAVRPHHPAARVLPDPGRALDPQRPRRRDRRHHRRRHADRAGLGHLGEDLAADRRALASAGTLRRIAPFDCSEEMLWSRPDAWRNDYPGIEVTAVVGDFHRHLGNIPTGGTRLLAFLGSTIGNLDPDATSPVPRRGVGGTASERVHDGRATGSFSAPT